MTEPLRRVAPAWVRMAQVALVCTALCASPAHGVAQAGQGFALTIERSAGPLAATPLRAALRARRDDLLDCLRPHGDLPGLAGARVSLRVMVASNGAIVTVEVREARGLDEERCVVAAVQRASFPARDAFTTFVVEVRLGRAVSGGISAVAAPTPANDGSVALSLTRVRGALRPSAARRGFTAALPALRVCYAAELRRTPAAPSRLHLVVRVDAEGHVRAVGDSGGSSISHAFERCVDAALRPRVFPAPTTGEAEIFQSLRLGAAPSS